MLYERIEIGGKEHTFCICASVNVCYQNVFHEDFIKIVSNGEESTSAFMKMAFIMAKFAELNDRKLVNQLTLDDYCDWLDQFTPGEIILALPKVEEAYMRESAGTVKTKKNNGEPTGK